MPVATGRGLIIGLHGELVYVAEPSLGTSKNRARGSVLAFSRRSASRLRSYLAAAESVYNVAATLTIPSWAEGATDCEQAKQWLCAMFRRIRREFWNKHENPSIVWVMERQKNRSVHFHLLTTHRIPYQWLARAWYEVVGTENEYHLSAGTEIHALRDRTAALRYIAKYLSKDSLSESQSVSERPISGRWWGVVGCRKQVEASFRVSGREAIEINPEGFAEVTREFDELIQELCAEGSAEKLDTSLWEHCGPGFAAWRVPDISVRRVIRSRIRKWCFRMRCILDSEEPDLDGVTMGGLKYLDFEPCL